MLCPNCKNKIDGVVDYCPKCNYSFKDEIDFGSINHKHNDLVIKTKEDIPYKRKRRIIVSIIFFLSLIGCVFYGYFNFYKKITIPSIIIDKVKDIFNENYELLNMESGNYEVKIAINGYNYNFIGDYDINLDDANIYINGYLDNSVKKDNMILNDRLFDYDLLLDDNKIISSSEILLPKDIVKNINNEITLKNCNKRKLINELLESIKDIIGDFKYQKGKNTINYLGKNTEVNTITYELTNTKKIDFLNKLVESVNSNSLLMDEISKVYNLNKSELIAYLNEKVKNYNYKLNNNFGEKLAINYKKNKIYSIEYTNRDIRDIITIEEDKYYFDRYLNDSNIYSGTIKKVKKDNSSNYYITFDRDDKVMDINISLRNSNKKINKKDFLPVSSEELTEEEKKIIKDNFGKYKLEEIFY